MPALLGIALYMVAQFAIGVWVSRRVRTESDYILAGRTLGYGLATFSIFATWFGAETIMGSAGQAYRDGISLGSAEPFGYGLCLLLFGLVFAIPLWRRQLTTLADLFRQRYSAGVERLAAVILIPSSILWAAAQIRAFGYVIGTSSTLAPGLAMGLAAGFTILYSAFGGMLVDAITDLIQGAIVIAGLAVILMVVLPLADGGVVAASSARLHLLPSGESGLAVLESWAIPIAGSVIATELVGRALAARSPVVAQRSFLMGGAMYIVIGAIPLVIGMLGPAIIPTLSDPEQLIPEIARTHLHPAMYAVFAGALLSAILSTVDSTLLTAAALLSHNVIVPVFGVVEEWRKVLAARGGVVAFGIIAWLLAAGAEGVFELVEQASAFGSAGALVAACFALFTNWGGPRAATTTLLVGLIAYLTGTWAGMTAPYLLALGLSVGSYVLVTMVWERSSPGIVPRS